MRQTALFLSLKHSPLAATQPAGCKQVPLQGEGCTERPSALVTNTCLMPRLPLSPPPRHHPWHAPRPLLRRKTLTLYRAQDTHTHTHTCSTQNTTTRCTARTARIPLNLIRCDRTKGPQKPCQAAATTHSSPLADFPAALFSYMPHKEEFCSRTGPLPAPLASGWHSHTSPGAATQHQPATEGLPQHSHTTPLSTQGDKKTGAGTSGCP